MNEIEIYEAPDGNTQVNVRFDKDTVWLSQVQLVELFMSGKANISEHLKNIFNSGELESEATVRNFRTVLKEGKREDTRNIEPYNPDARHWATQRLKDYLENIKFAT